jgi:hypothetical protein
MMAIAASPTEVTLSSPQGDEASHGSGSATGLFRVMLKLVKKYFDAISSTCVVGFTSVKDVDEFDDGDDNTQKQSVSDSTTARLGSLRNLRATVAVWSWKRRSIGSR